jgi:hypothetical protein
MAMYRVTGIRTGDCPAHHEFRHIVEARLAGSDGEREVGVSVLRLMLSSGDNLYTQSPTTDAKADVTKGRCECGFKTVRSVRSDVTDNDITSVPAYS